MAYATPRTWVAGDVLTAAQMNQDVRDNVAFLANPPACRVFHNASQAVADAATITVAFNSERFDNAAMHDNVTNNSRITIPTAGVYVVTFSGSMQASAYLLVSVGIRLNGATMLAHSTRENATAAFGVDMSVSTVYKFAAADYVEARVFQDNAAAASMNLTVSANSSPEFSAAWIGFG